MAISVSYLYKIEAKFVLDGKEETILPEGMTSIITNYDYDNNNIPIIYMGVKLETSLYNKMIINQEKANIVLTISKAKTGGNFSVFATYIHDRFNYTMSTNPDYNVSMEKQTDTKDKIILSRKRENSEGIGLKSMRAICEKYNGTLEIKYDNENFVILIILTREMNNK